MNPLQRLHPEFGQSIWLDFISRELLDSGELSQLVERGEVRGVTSNPAIFEKAIGDGKQYASFLAQSRKSDPKATSAQLYESLAVRDIQSATKALEPIYASSKARDGYVSLEVTMRDGETTAAILDEARRLWKAVARPNVMIKVPGTADGLVAFETLISEGINVNVTLLFAVDTYVKVAKHYIAGLEKRVKNNADVSKVASVASFFVSRIDSNVDKQLETQTAAAKTDKDRAAAKALMGKVAVANAKVAYAEYEKLFSGKKWDALAKKGAMTQRVLWASTGTKNKAYSDVLYIEELIGQDTVNTAPPQTIDAFRDHGKPRASLTEDVDGARKVLADLEKRGISLKKVTDELLADGLKQFSDAFVKLIGAIDTSKGDSKTPSSAPKAKQAEAFASAPSSAKGTGFAEMTFAAPKDVIVATHAAIDDWKKSGKVARLWARDAKVWTNSDEAKWLGWLDAPATASSDVADLTAFAAEAKKDGLTQVLLLGMGGSSLCPDVLRHTFGASGVEVVDSTDPAQIAATEKKLDLARTLVIVASKSGSTLEPNIFEAYFWERMVKAVGATANKHFVAITDPGSKLENLAKQKKYRRIFAGVPSIGGRFSALSNFGMVPAALIGLDLARFTARAVEMAQACKQPDATVNPGVRLGALMGACANAGRDKLTLVVSPQIQSLGAWLEQLVAESTGKHGKGIVPIDMEPLGAPGMYGDDRLFVYVRLESAPDKAQDSAVDALEHAGHAVARIRIADKIDIGAEFFRFEIATAVAGALIGIDPFDQPDVEASKIVTKELTSAYEKSGSLPPEKPFFEEGKVRLYADAKFAQRLFKATGANASLVDVLRAHLGLAKAGDYFALLAYVDMNAKNRTELAAIRDRVRDAKHIATCLEFGPRFLHSTGQAYKGGPNSGVFLQITCDDAADLLVPGAKYTFGVVKAAQARGDFQVLVERGRRALRAHIEGDLTKGLGTLRSAMIAALSKPAHASN
jgi:transaldolase/glucose-6-phosphate isomerase